MMPTAPERLSAVLLLGPTGSGKTPLGQLLAQTGLGGRRCHHLDFGEELRRAAAGEGAEGLSPQEVAHVRRVLGAGALLEDEQFGIAAHILTAFVARRAVGPEDLIVLNGLPRHVGQATALEALLDVELVVHLDCPAEVGLARVRADAGGDRAGRADDDADSVRRRAAAFAERTLPLLDHYRSRGARIETVPVTAAARATDLHRGLTEAMRSAHRSRP